MISGVLLINARGAVELSRYLDGRATPNELATFEGKLLRALVFADQNFNVRQFCQVHGFHVAFQRLDELTVVLLGSDGSDEMVLAPVLDSVLDLLREQLGRCTERSLLNSENYGKVLIALDELASQGILETTDPDTIARISKMKA